MIHFHRKKPALRNNGMSRTDVRPTSSSGPYM
eukprot:COSAG04_NODE_27784_length_280_cov_0.569061_2_plen_31_part_01